MSAKDTASFGSVVNSLDALAGTTATNGTEYAIPGNKAVAITWQTVFSSAPSAVNVVLQLSNDGSTFVTADTSTNTAGEIRTVNTSAKFFRTRLVSKTGGGTTTTPVVLQPYAVTVVNYAAGAGVWGTITGTLADQLDLQSALDAKITSLADPGADRILFWHDSLGAYDYLIPGTNISITDKTINVAGGNPFDQDLNTDDDVEFASILFPNAGKLSTKAVNNTAIDLIQLTDDDEIVIGSSNIGSVGGFGTFNAHFFSLAQFIGHDGSGILQVVNPTQDAGAGLFYFPDIGSGAFQGITSLGTGANLHFATEGGISTPGMILDTGDNLTILGFVKATLKTATPATTGLVAGELAALTDATLVITDSTGQVYRVPAKI